MAETTTHPTPTAAPADKTLWKNGAGVGAVIGSAICSVITVGLGMSQPAPATPAGYVIPAVLVACGALFGALCGSIIGSCLPAVAAKADDHH
jgi:fructose-specific phosphotransferase system IIC component